MKTPDETDLEILRLLAENARRPYSEIAEHVNLSAPAVSDRVTRLEEHGIIRQFTIDIDRSQLRDGIPVLVRIHPRLSAVDSLQQELLQAEDVEHVFITAASEIMISATPPHMNIRKWLQTIIKMENVRKYEVRLLSDIDWSVNITGTDFTLTCTECGNTVGADGTATRIGGELQQFCCSSCQTTFKKRYEKHHKEAEM